ncbi:hypothetical protein ROZALSC1DRAFT_30916, partial [Rozella allomycis CSF55]
MIGEDRSKAAPMDFDQDPLAKKWNLKGGMTDPFIFQSPRSSDNGRKKRKLSTINFSSLKIDEEKKPQNMSRFGWILDTLNHRHLPYIIIGYLQVLLNSTLVGVIMYLIYLFISAIQRDVEIKVNEYLVEIMNEIASCSKNYVENKCDPMNRVPAMEKSCVIWETCMNRDPAVIGRAKVSAETFAEIINSFVEPISYKTMLFFVIVLCGSFFVSNMAFSYAKQKFSDEPPKPNKRRDISPSNSIVIHHTTDRTPVFSPPKLL